MLLLIPLAGCTRPICYAMDCEYEYDGVIETAIAQATWNETRARDGLAQAGANVSGPPGRPEGAWPDGSRATLMNGGAGVVTLVSFAPQGPRGSYTSGELERKGARECPHWTETFERERADLTSATGWSWTLLRGCGASHVITPPPMPGEESAP